MRKLSVIKLLKTGRIALSLSLLQSCKKNESIVLNTKADIDVLSTSATEDMMSAHRIISPYSHKVIRLLRERVSASNDPKLIAALNKSLKPSNVRLYYRIKVEDENQANALNNWLSDSNNVVVRYPIDSVHLFPEIFTDEKLNELEDQNSTFYTTVSIQSPLSSSINAQIMDTLYIPDETETALDFMLNLITANFSNEFISQLQVESPSLYDYVMAFHDNNMYIKSEDINYSGSDINGNEFNPFGDMNFRPRELYDPVGGGNPYVAVKVPKSKNVTFTDNTLGNNEGVNNLKVVATRFVIIPRTHTTRTNVNGQFTSSLPRYGVGVLNLVFNNDKVRIRGVDISSHTVAGTIFGILKGVVGISVPATVVRFVNPTNNVNNYTINFPHGSKQALWSMTYNAIQEANQYSVNLNLYNNNAATKFLDVMCLYGTNRMNFRCGAPMLQYIGSYPEGTNLLFNLSNISSMTGNAMPGLLPDLWITEGVQNPRNSINFRQVIYHEYGHALHYFKANTINNNHWKHNIGQTITGTYGNDINGVKGAFFALSEGWAEYIGQLFASMKYENVSGRNVTNSTDGTIALYDATAPYLTHLENNPTFANSFIPKGLFFDLTDGFNNNESLFDNVDGFNTNDIFQTLSPTIYTIQDFRTQWLNQRTNATSRSIHEILFNRYNVN